MKTLKSILPIVCFSSLFFSYQKAHSQKLLDNTRVYLGFSFQEQDRRLFEFPHAEEIVALEESKFDYETIVYVQKTLLKWWHFGLSTGLGYMRYQNKFTRPINHQYFTGDHTRPLIFINKYTTHKISIPTSLEFSFDKKERIFLSLTGWASFNFNKRLVSVKKYDNKLKLEFNGLELNPGLGFKASRLRFQINYRALNYYKIDKVILYRILFKDDVDPFLDKKYESTNWDKIWITVGYDLSKKKP
jgi:hypothetical protein